MRPASSIADRAADFALRLIAAVNLIFVALFVLVTMMATAKVHAEETACTGDDLTADLQRTDPGLLADIERTAARTPNGEGLLWKIEKDGAKPSFLFGTMHLTDPRVIDMPDAAGRALDAADTVVIETTDVLDPAGMTAVMQRHPDLMLFTDGRTLTSLLDDGDRATVEKGLASRGIALSAVDTMKPWMLTAMVAMPACELARKQGGADFLDIKLARDAAAGGKELKGLETMTDQLSAMASLPLDFHMRGLVETLAMGDMIDDVMETMVVLYTEQKTGMIWPLLRGVSPEQSSFDYAAFERTMVTARNATMVDNARPILDRGNAFIAVGALHLPGDKGLVALLRDAGYSVTRVE